MYTGTVPTVRMTVNYCNIVQAPKYLGAQSPFSSNWHKHSSLWQCPRRLTSLLSIHLHPHGLSPARSQVPVLIDGYLSRLFVSSFFVDNALSAIDVETNTLKTLFLATSAPVCLIHARCVYCTCLTLHPPCVCFLVPSQKQTIKKWSSTSSRPHLPISSMSSFMSTRPATLRPRQSSYQLPSMRYRPPAMTKTGPRLVNQMDIDGQTKFSQDSIVKDLKLDIDKPSWPLSSYGPSKYAPTFQTGLDMSMEEMRVKAMQAQLNGTVNEYVRFVVFVFALPMLTQMACSGSI
jgi:hypothetical protein